MVFTRAAVALCIARAALESASCATLHAQQVVLPESPACATCVVSLQRITTLGLRDSGFVRSEPIWMSRDSRGRIYVTWQNYGHGPELAAVYDSLGQFIQELGRKGNGPVEKKRSANRASHPVVQQRIPLGIAANSTTPCSMSLM